MRLGHHYSRQGRTTLAIDRLGRGLSAFPQDSTFAANSATLLDSLLGVSGGDPRSVHAHVTQQLEASKRAYWLDSHRDGHRAPDAALVDMDSERRVSLRGLSGITVAYAWATWCGPCRASMPTLQAWAGKARTRPVRVLTINAEGEPLPSAKAKTSKFFTERGLTCCSPTQPPRPAGALADSR
jgi:thiol-disulfide isomerase/thioredoxin